MRRSLLLSLAIGVALPNTALAGEPPYPNELLYPNVVSPQHQFGTFGSVDGTFSEPRSSCYLDESTLLVSDSGNRRLQVVSIDGKYLRPFDPQRIQIEPLVSPAGVSCRDGTIAVADKGSGRVLLSDLSGKEILKLVDEKGTEYPFRYPDDVWLGHNSIIVSESENEDVIVFSKSGKFRYRIVESTPGQRLQHPMSAVTDEAENIYVAEGWGNRISKFDQAGRFVTSWGSWGSHAGFFATPSSLFYKNGRLYVTDLTNHRIQVFDSNGAFLFQWGRHPITGHEGNGRTHYPSDIAISPTGESFTLTEPTENRFQVFGKPEIQKVVSANDSAWWDKATRFHYGSRSEGSGTILAVSEPDTHSVLIFDISKETPELITRVGGYGNSVGSLIEPSGLAINSTTGTITVSDAGNFRIQEFGLVKRGSKSNIEGLFTGQGYLFERSKANFSRSIMAITNQPAERQNPEKVGKAHDFREVQITNQARPVEGSIYPGSMKKGPNGDLYVYDQANAMINIVRDGTTIKAFGGYGSEDGRFKGVHNMAFSRDGTKLFVVDSYNFRIQVFDTFGNFLFKFGTVGQGPGKFIHIFGIAAGVDGNVYVSDEPQHMIHKFTEDGTFVKSWGRWGTGNGEFYKPKGLYQSPDGRLFILNFGNHRGDIFTPEGEFIRSFGLADPTSPSAVRAQRMISYSTIDAKQASSLWTSPVLAQTVLNARVTKRISEPMLMSNTGDLTLSISQTSAGLSPSRAIQLRIKVVQNNRKDFVPDQLIVSARMPAHAHGTGTAPTVTKVSEQEYLVDNVVFQMPGYWDLYLDLVGKTETVRSEIPLFIR